MNIPKIYDENGKELTMEQIMKNYITFELPKTNRVEVIDENGRSYENWNDNNKVEISMQDEGRTLKVFIKSG